MNQSLRCGRCWRRRCSRTRPTTPAWTSRCAAPKIPGTDGIVGSKAIIARKLAHNRCNRKVGIVHLNSKFQDHWAEREEAEAHHHAVGGGGEPGHVLLPPPHPSQPLHLLHRRHGRLHPRHLHLGPLQQADQQGTIHIRCQLSFKIFNLPMPAKSGIFS